MDKIQSIINGIPARRIRRPISTIMALLFDLDSTNRTFQAVDENGDIFSTVGSTIPTAGTSGYAVGASFALTDAVLGQCVNWINAGSATSCLFVPVGEVNGYGFLYAGGRGGTNTAATEIITGEGFANTDIAIAGHVKSDDTDTILSVAMTDDEGEMLITASADPSTTHGYLWAALRNKCLPKWDIFAAGTQACTAATTTAITVAGVLATDIAIAGYSASDDSDTIVKTICSANTVTVTHSTTSSTLHSVDYVVLRQRGTFAPSHYIAYAGIHTTVGGAAAEAITVTGALATDLAIVVYETTNDTDTIAKSVLTADTLTVTASADPSTAHAFAYMILRAY